MREIKVREKDREKKKEVREKRDKDQNKAFC